MVSAKLVHGIKRREIDLPCDPLPGGDFQSRLRLCAAEGRDRLFLTAAELESQPGLAVSIVKLNIASSQICDGNRRHDGFIRNVLQSLEFQVHLDLRLCRIGEKKNGRREKSEADDIAQQTPSRSDANNTSSKQFRHRADGFFEGGNCCKSREGSAWTACNSSS